MSARVPGAGPAQSHCVGTLGDRMLMKLGEEGDDMYHGMSMGLGLVEEDGSSGPWIQVMVTEVLLWI